MSNWTASLLCKTGGGSAEQTFDVNTDLNQKKNKNDSFFLSVLPYRNTKAWNWNGRPHAGAHLSKTSVRAENLCWKCKAANYTITNARITWLITQEPARHALPTCDLPAGRFIAPVSGNQTTATCCSFTAFAAQTVTHACWYENEPLTRTRNYRLGKPSAWSGATPAGEEAASRL